MIIAIIVLVISLICSILGFVFRKTVGAVSKLIPFIAAIFIFYCFARSVPVVQNVSKYEKLSKVNIEELKKDTKEYEEYVEQVQEINAWLVDYKEQIENHPAITFCKDKIKSFTEIEIEP